MIQRTATDPRNCARRLEFTSAARVAWRLVLQGLRCPEGSSILLPAYIGITDREGSGISDPVEETGTPVSFYPLDDRLRPDHDALERMLASGKHPLLLVVHYFGLVHVDLQRLRAACRRHGVLLVEDCAHVPNPLGDEDGPGAYGNAAFYSLHKAIAVPSGGMLRVNDAGLALGACTEADQCAPACLGQLLRTDLRAAAERRRENYRWLAERLATIDGLTVPWPDLGTCVPHDFPVLIHDGLREKLYFALMAEQLPTIALYYRLIDAITPADYPVSHAFSRSILNLPVHQDTDVSDLRHLTERLTAHLGMLRA